MKRLELKLLLSGLLAALPGCQSAVRNTVYSAYESVGIHKRDLLKRRVANARDEQRQTAAQFKDALTRLQDLYGFQGGQLEKIYNGLKRDYDHSHEKAEAVRGSIRSVETVAGDLFKEWEEEIGEIQTASLQARSRQQLQETRRRYEDLHAALARAEAAIEPVLAKFHDQVLFLKHDLNAQAVASLKGESARIQIDVQRLLSQMNASIREADRFIQALSPPA